MVGGGGLRQRADNTQNGVAPLWAIRPYGSQQCDDTVGEQQVFGKIRRKSGQGRQCLLHWYGTAAGG